MALIKCPECGKEVSDKAPACIHCGCPLNKQVSKVICNINGKEFDFSDVASEILETSNPLEGMKFIRRVCDMAPTDARTLYNIINETKKIPAKFDCSTATLLYQGSQHASKSKYGSKEKVDFTSASQREPINRPKCPTCGSTSIRKVSAASKAGSVALWGIFSQKVKKQWHCNNCGSEW